MMGILDSMKFQNEGLSARTVLVSTLILLVGSVVPAFAEDAEPTADLDWAQVRFVVATHNANQGTWRFDVTVQHHDEGWDHYATGWDLYDPETDEVVATRVLLHPHEREQPFTRSLDAVDLQGRRFVIVRAFCQVHGYGGHEVTIDLESSEDEYYEIRRQ